MKIKKYTNGAWTDLDKPVKKYDTYTDEATTLPLTIEASATDAVDNYQVYGASGGVGERAENLFDKDAKDTNNGYGDNVFLRDTGAINSSINYYVSEYIEVSANSTYTISALSGSNPSVCQYDANKDYIIGNAYENNSEITITTNAGTKYIRVSVRKANEPLFMITPGSTAPTSYIPYGYKIPILNTSGVTENLFDKTTSYIGYYLQYSTGNLAGSPNSNASEYIDVSDLSNIVIVLERTDALYSTAKREYLLYDENKEILSYDFYAVENVTKVTLSVDVTNVHFIRFDYDKSYNEIMLVKGSTAPDHYIPHRYTSNYDLMLGGSKLYADEYLDFVEQKVYKRTAQLFDYETMAPISERGKYLKQNGDTQNATSWAITDYIPLDDTSITLSLMSNIGSAPSVCVYDQNKIYLDGMEYNGQVTKKLNITGAAYARFSYIWDNTAPAASTIDKIMLNSGSTAEPFAYYYNPVDPPAPFPALTTYIGGNNLSVDTTVQPEKVAVEYEGWKGVGDVEKYQNGEWSDNNDI